MDRVPAVIDQNMQLPVEAGREIAESLRLLAYCLEQAGRR